MNVYIVMEEYRHYNNDDSIEPIATCATRALAESIIAEKKADIKNKWADKIDFNDDWSEEFDEAGHYQLADTCDYEYLYEVWIVEQELITEPTPEKKCKTKKKKYVLNYSERAWDDPNEYVDKYNKVYDTIDDALNYVRKEYITDQGIEPDDPSYDEDMKTLDDILSELLLDSEIRYGNSRWTIEVA